VAQTKAPPATHPAARPGAPAEPARPYRSLKVAPENAGWRLDAYLSARFSSWSRTAAARAIREGEVLSPTRPLKPASILESGEELRIYDPRFAPEGPAPALPPILYEDDHLIVLNKPPGLLVHPAGNKWAWAIIGLVREARPTARIDLCHRLDRDTSGVLVLSKELGANVFVKECLKARDEDLQKTYQAIVEGSPNWDELVVDAPIGEAKGSEVRLRRGINPEGLQARTTFTVLRRLGDLSLVSCLLHTGRTHQIRVHLEHVGHPILGDRLYGRPDSIFLEWLDVGATPAVRAAARFPRQCLHAWTLRLPQPAGPPLDLLAPLPEDMASLLAGAAPEWPESVTVERDEVPEEEPLP
jgi:RluA family pseudouridine synthase